MMIKKSKKKLVTGIILSALVVPNVFAQTDVSGFFPAKNELTIAPSYTFKNSERFYRGKTLNPGNPAMLGAITSNIINLYAEYGITDWLSSTVSIPYIKIKSETGMPDPVQKTDVVDGIQDLSIDIKGKISEINFEDSSKITFGAIANTRFPIGNYDGKGVLSLGNAAPAYSLSLNTQYTTSFNLFVGLQGGYSLRKTTSAKVPNATVYAAKLGYIHEFFYIDTQFGFQNSLDGLDIDPTPGSDFANAGGPAALQQTENDYILWSFNLYVPVYKNMLGVSASYAHAIDGRNFGKEKSYSIGLVYKPEL